MASRRAAGPRATAAGPRPIASAPSRRAGGNRAIVLAAAAVAACANGSMQAWSVFGKPLAESFGWSVVAVSLAFSIMVLTSCVSALIAGKLQGRLGPGVQVLFGGCLYALGWILTGFAASLPALYVSYGLIGGFGNGFTFNTVVSVATKWFPDKRGFANGVVIGAMGLAPLLFAPLGSSLIATWGIQWAFRVLGALLLAMYAVSSPFLKWPGEIAEGASAAGGARDAGRGQEDMRLSQAARTGRFWLMWAFWALAASPGTMMLGHASAIGQQVAGIAPGQAALLVGVMAVANFSGRLAFGSLSDRFGRYRVLGALMAVTAVVMLAFFGRAHGAASFGAVLCLVAACYGGVMAIMPSLCGDTFGPRHMGENYAVLYTAYTAASFAGPGIAASFVASGGSYAPAFPVAGSLALAALLVAAAGLHASRKDAARCACAQRGPSAS